MEQTNKSLDVSKLQQIELPKFDSKPFINQKAIVDEVILKEKEQQDGKISHYVLFKALVDVTGFNGKPLYASRIIGVQMTEKGVIGWGKDTKMQKFLDHHNIKSPLEMKGKTIITIPQQDSNYLTF